MTTRSILRWTPRVLAIGFILFLALFALDVFGEDYSLPEMLVGLFMHLIPNFLLLIALVIAWKRSIIGGLVFIVLGTVSILYFDSYRQLISFLMVSFPAYVIGVLFVLDELLCDGRLLKSAVSPNDE